MENMKPKTGPYRVEPKSIAMPDMKPDNTKIQRGAMGEGHPVQHPTPEGNLPQKGGTKMGPDHMDKDGATTVPKPEVNKNIYW